MSTQPIPKVSKSVRLQQELDIALQENAALQEKLTEASQAAEPAPMQTINFQPQLLGEPSQLQCDWTFQGQCF